MQEQVSTGSHRTALDTLLADNCLQKQHVEEKGCRKKKSCLYPSEPRDHTCARSSPRKLLYYSPPRPPGPGLYLALPLQRSNPPKELDTPCQSKQDIQEIEDAIPDVDSENNDDENDDSTNSPDTPALEITPLQAQRSPCLALPDPFEALGADLSQLCLEEEALAMQLSPWLADIFLSPEYVTPSPKWLGAPRQAPGYIIPHGSSPEDNVVQHDTHNNRQASAPLTKNATEKASGSGSASTDADDNSGDRFELGFACPAQWHWATRPFATQAEAFAHCDSVNASQPEFVVGGSVQPLEAASRGNKQETDRFSEINTNDGTNNEQGTVPDGCMAPGVHPDLHAGCASTHRRPLSQDASHYLALLEACRSQQSTIDSSSEEGSDALDQMRDDDASEIDQTTGNETSATKEVVLRQEAMRAFCVERPSRSGGHFRSFVAATFSGALMSLRRLGPQERHWYEVIREGRPCHLYYDLEFRRELNRDIDGAQLTARLLEHTASAFQEEYGLSTSSLALDSTTAEKFSRHVIVHVPGHAFRTNADAGRFVLRVLRRSGKELHVVQSVDPATSEPVVASLVDTAVYTRNRHFRLIWCCKGGKTATLETVEGRFEGITLEEGGPACEQAFARSLVTWVQSGSKLLEMPEPTQSMQPCVRGNRCLIPSASGAIPLAGGGQGVRVGWKISPEEEGQESKEFLAEIKHLGEKAIPFLERTATTRAGGLSVRIRSLVLCGTGGLVAYSLAGPGCHYCENIGRSHASNHAFYVANFLTGLFAQKCYDPLCAGFRSDWMPLPPDLSATSN